MASTTVTRRSWAGRRLPVLLLVLLACVAPFATYLASASPLGAFGDDPHDYTPVQVYNNTVNNPAPGNPFDGGMNGYLLYVAEPGYVYSLNVSGAFTAGGVRVLREADVGAGCDSNNTFHLGDNQQQLGYVAVVPPEDPGEYSYICMYYYGSWQSTSVTLVLNRVWQQTSDVGPDAAAYELPLDSFYTGINFYDLDDLDLTGGFEVYAFSEWGYHHNAFPSDPSLVDDPIDLAENNTAHMAARVTVINLDTEEEDAWTPGFTVHTYAAGNWRIVVDATTNGKPGIVLVAISGVGIGPTVTSTPTVQPTLNPAGCVLFTSHTVSGGEGLDIGQLNYPGALATVMSVGSPSSLVTLHFGPNIVLLGNGQSATFPPSGVEVYAYSPLAFTLKVCPPNPTPTGLPTITPAGSSPCPVYAIAPGGTLTRSILVTSSLWTRQNEILPSVQLSSINGTFLAPPLSLPIWTGGSGLLGYNVAPSVYVFRNPATVGQFVMICPFAPTATPLRTPTPTLGATQTFTPGPTNTAGPSPTQTNTPTASASPTTGATPTFLIPTVTPNGTRVPVPTFPPSDVVDPLCERDPCYTVGKLGEAISDILAELSIPLDSSCELNIAEIWLLNPAISGSVLGSIDWSNIGPSFCWFIDKTSAVREVTRSLSLVMAALFFGAYFARTMRRIGDV